MNVKVETKSLDLLICFCFSFVDQLDLIVYQYVESETKIYNILEANVMLFKLWLH